MSTPNFRLPKLGTHYVVDDDDCEWRIDDVKSELSVVKNFEENSGYVGDAQIIGSVGFYVYDHYAEIEEYVRLYVTVESGYYSGVMFDVDTSEFEGLEISKTNQKALDAKIAQIERILAQHTTKIRRVAVFSNGEAIYEEVA